MKYEVRSKRIEKEKHVRMLDSQITILNHLITILDIRITINILRYSADSAGSKNISPAESADFRRKIRCSNAS